VQTVIARLQSKQRLPSCVVLV